MKLKNVCKRLSAQYLKGDFTEKVIITHLEAIGNSISKDNFIRETLKNYFQFFS